MASICVFSGSQAGDNPTFAAAAKLLADAMVDRRHHLIYGGGSVGLMGVMADTMLARSGTVIGVIPEALAARELMHADVCDMRVVPDMHVRKATMHQLADAYIALPGGFGTLEELFEVLCWRQLDFHQCPIAILNTNGFYNGLLEQLSAMVDNSFLDPANLELLHATERVPDLIAWMDTHVDHCTGGH